MLWFLLCKDYKSALLVGNFPPVLQRAVIKNQKTTINLAFFTPVS